jgi:hypothetical protein
MEQALALPRTEWRCSFHDDHDAEGEPAGNQCTSEATHIIVWTWPDTGEQRWSFGCAEHIGPPALDPSGANGWRYSVEALPCDGAEA